MRHTEYFQVSASWGQALISLVPCYPRRSAVVSLCLEWLNALQEVSGVMRVWSWVASLRRRAVVTIFFWSSMVTYVFFLKIYFEESIVGFTFPNISASCGIQCWEKHKNILSFIHSTNYLQWPPAGLQDGFPGTDRVVTRAVVGWEAHFAKYWFLAEGMFGLSRSHCTVDWKKKMWTITAKH